MTFLCAWCHALEILRWGLKFAQGWKASNFRVFTIFPHKLCFHIFGFSNFRAFRIFTFSNFRVFLSLFLVFVFFVFSFFSSSFRGGIALLRLELRHLKNAQYLCYDPFPAPAGELPPDVVCYGGLIILNRTKFCAFKQSINHSHELSNEGHLIVWPS